MTSNSDFIDSIQERVDKALELIGNSERKAITKEFFRSKEDYVGRAERSGGEHAGLRKKALDCALRSLRSSPVSSEPVRSDSTD